MNADWLRQLDRTRDGLAVDIGLYTLSAGFAWLTMSSNLPAHRPWGTIAAAGYAIAALIALSQLITRTRRGRLTLTLGTWAAVCLLPLLVEAIQRAGGRADRAQEEVHVVEQSGIGLLDTGTPYLSRNAIAALPDPLLGYTPYQPGMAIFGIPRGLLGAHWYTDARIWFAAATAICLYLATRLKPSANPASRVRTAPADTLKPSANPASRVRAVQAVTVVPVAALTLATGGDDLPVLALTLLALAYVAKGRDLAAGVVLGLAAGLKLFAWPVAVVLLLARPAWRFATPVVAIPLATALPALVVDPHAFVENVLAFPLGHGLVKSPAASPLPGYLITNHIPGGRYIALALLGIVAAALGWWLLRRPPRTAAAAAAVCAIGLLAAISLLPATRFGYLLYPVAYALWIPFLRATAQDPLNDGHVHELRQV